MSWEQNEAIQLGAPGFSPLLESGYRQLPVSDRVLAFGQE